MKGLINKSLLFISIFAISTAFAATTSENVDQKPNNMVGSPNCKNVIKACKAAGFSKKHAAAGKSLFKDCVKPLLAGQSVSGVSADPADVQACSAHRASKNNDKSQKPAQPAASPDTGASS